jgi:CRP-like cAMP-binding protein
LYCRIAVLEFNGDRIKVSEAGFFFQILESVTDRSLITAALHHPTRICSWPQDLLENLVSVSPGLVHRICEEVRGYIESRLAAHATGFKDVETNLLSGSFSNY